MIAAALLANPTQMQEVARTLSDLGSRLHRAMNKSVGLDATDAELVGINVSELLFALGGLVLALALRWFLVWIVGRILHKSTGPDDHDWQDSVWVLIMRFVSAAVVMFALFYACAVILLPKKPVNWDLWLWQFYLTIGIAYITWLAIKTISFFVKRLVNRADRLGRNEQLQALPLIRDLLKVAAVIVAVVFGVQVWGYNAATLLAGVGIGGLAIAFAAQDFIANIFGTMVVWSDHPYKVGDHVIIDDVEGRVEEIGVRSTRIRMFDRTLVSVPNKAAANDKVFNITAMNKRRIRFTIGLIYDTTPEEMQAAADAINEIIMAQDDLEEETHWAYMTEFAAYSQDILLQCFVTSPEFQDFLHARHKLLLSIRTRFNEMGLEFAFPTQVEYTYKVETPQNDYTPPPADAAGAGEENAGGNGGSRE